MLYITWLLLAGSWAQVKINWEVQAPVTGAPMAVVYAAGSTFAVCAGVLLLRQLWRVLSGRAGDDELVMVTESEETAELQELQKQIDREDAAGRLRQTGGKP